MSEKRQPFDPDDPFDATAECLRKAVLDAVLQVMSAESYRALGRQEQVEAILTGRGIGVCCTAMAHIGPVAHAEIPSVLIAALPEWFAVAQSIETDGVTLQ